MATSLMLNAAMPAACDSSNSTYTIRSMSCFLFAAYNTNPAALTPSNSNITRDQTRSNPVTLPHHVFK